MNCNTSRFGSKVIHRTAFGTDVSIRSRRTLKAPCKYAALFFHIWYNNLKPAACAATRISCADAPSRMGLRTLNHAKFQRLCHCNFVVAASRRPVIITSNPPLARPRAFHAPMRGISPPAYKIFSKAGVRNGCRNQTAKRFFERLGVGQHSFPGAAAYSGAAH